MKVILWDCLVVMQYQVKNAKNFNSMLKIASNLYKVLILQCYCLDDVFNQLCPSDYLLTSIVTMPEYKRPV